MINLLSFLISLQTYGPDGVFYSLSRSCYEHKSSGYEYEVCPFKHVRQQQFPQSSKNIGQRAVWRHMRDGLYILIMDEGDATLCPEGFGRSSVVCHHGYLELV